MLLWIRHKNGFTRLTKKLNLIIFYGFLVIREIRRGPLGPRSQNFHFSLYEKKNQKIISVVLTIDFPLLFNIDQKSQKNQCSKINGFSDIDARN